MTERREGVPDTIPPDSSRPVGGWEAHVEDLQRRMREGNRTIEGLRNRLDEQRDELAKSRAALQLEIARVRADAQLEMQRAATLAAQLVYDARRALEVRLLEDKKSLETRIVDVAAAAAPRKEFDELSKEVAPRAAPLRLLGWFVFVVGAVGGIIAEHYSAENKFMDRAEYRGLEERIRAIETRETALETRMAVMKGTP